MNQQNFELEKEPLGYDKEEKFYKLFPQVTQPFQLIERVQFGHPDLEPNRLFCGDNLHVMRQLPDESIDLIYIDPPFFSGRNYKVIFGDSGEIRSFSDIWEGGMSSYLIWLNARLYEMKRLLKKTGSIYVHCDHHASHYIKVEMDKIFGYESFENEIVWTYRTGGTSKNYFPRKHDILFWYSKSKLKTFNQPMEKTYIPSLANRTFAKEKLNAKIDKDGCNTCGLKGQWYKMSIMRDVWEIQPLFRNSRERIGYPTQKPETLLERVIQSSSNMGDVVADFFCGGGTTAAVAQKLSRRWITCDQSQVAISVTKKRLMDQVKKQINIPLCIPDFTIENCS